MEWSKLVPELTVSHFGESLRFYTEVLGFDLAFSRSDPNFAYLDHDGVQLMLEEAPPGWSVGELTKPYGRGINFEMAWRDVVALRDRLVASDYPLYRDLRDTWRDTGDTSSGAREFLIQDPDGYLLRFAESLGEREKIAGSPKRMNLPLAQPESVVGPWNLSALEQSPTCGMGDMRQVREGDRTVRLSEMYYTGEPWMWRPTRVFAYFARPDVPSSQTHPAMVLVHGGGGTASQEWACHWAQRGYAALAMDLYGKGPGGERIADGGADWGDLDIAFRLTAGVENGWVYQAVANVIRGISALGSLPGVDANRIGITGVSWGGILTCLAMSLDRRLKLAVPVYGFGFNPMMGCPPNPTDAECEVIRTNFEPGVYLPRCTLPVLWMSGTNEPHANMERLRQSYRAAGGPRTLSVTVRPSHIHPQMADVGWERPEAVLFADSIFRGTPGLITVTRTEVIGDVLHVGYEGAVPLGDAAMHWTAETDKEWRERRWQSAWATKDGETAVHVELPKERPAIVFVTLMDRRGAVVSTEHLYLE